MTSWGNPAQISNARSNIYYAIALGLMLEIFGFVPVQIIAADVPDISGFK